MPEVIPIGPISPAKKTEIAAVTRECNDELRRVGPRGVNKAVRKLRKRALEIIRRQGG